MKNAQTCQRITGITSRTPAQMLSQMDVMNGSPGLRVTSCRCFFGSGCSSQWIRWRWKTNATIVATTTAPMQVKSRWRSSSRCSTSDASSP